jgi:hypothetical protein
MPCNRSAALAAWCATSATRKTDADAIAYHYDVSNDFYRLWLDEDMAYSCAYFKEREDALDQVQIQKLDHVLRKIRVQPGQRLLDIGCRSPEISCMAGPPETFGRRWPALPIFFRCRSLANFSEWARSKRVAFSS